MFQEKFSPEEIPKILAEIKQETDEREKKSLEADKIARNTLDP